MFKQAEPRLETAAVKPHESGGGEFGDKEGGLGAGDTTPSTAGRVIGFREMAMSPGAIVDVTGMPHSGDALDILGSGVPKSCALIAAGRAGGVAVCNLMLGLAPG